MLLSVYLRRRHPPAAAFALRVSLSLVLLEAWGTIAARADLSVTGGTALQQATLKSAYSALPACCRTSRMVCVCLLDNAAMNACLRANTAAHAQRLVNADAVDGFYRASRSVITLRAPSPSADVSATFTHEFGHFVWMNLLSPAQRDGYRKVYDTQHTSGHLVSPYAAVSLEEGFAEAFSFYVRGNSVLAGRDPASCCFLAGLLNTDVKTGTVSCRGK